MPDQNTPVTGRLMDVLQGLVEKQGIVVVVLLALMWFIWDSSKNNRTDNARMAPIVERNTEAITRNTVIQERAIQVGMETQNVLDNVRVELLRKTDRRHN